MGDRTITDRLQPSLLDRLRDDAPESETESREARVVDLKRLREIVRRDLASLLNTTNIETLYDMEAHPHVARSTLNYGIVDVAGSGATSMKTKEIRLMIRKAIERFEPRILPGTLEVVQRTEAGDIRATVYFDIRGELWAQPLPVQLYLRSELDATSGEFRLEQAG